MNSLFRFFYLLLMLFLTSTLMISSCKKNKDEAQPAEYQITFNFSHRVVNENLEFDTIKYLNAFGNKYSVMTLKYFISNITLHKPDGGTLLFNEDHYIDASDSATLTFIPAGKTPQGDYSGISFIFGLDSLKNITGRFPDPPENKMEWPVAIGGGYHYLKLEGKFDSAGIIKNYQCHTGQAMGTPYFINVTLPASSFTVDGKGKTIRIIMDINEWWMNPNTLDLNSITEIMMNPVFQKYLQENGSDVFSIGTVKK